MEDGISNLNEDLNKKSSCITAALSSDITIKATKAYDTQKISLSNIVNYSGVFSASSLTDGGIKVPDNVTQVKVSASICINTTPTKYSGAYIYLDSAAMTTGYAYLGDTNLANISLPPKIIPCSPGQIISLYIYLNSANENSTIKSYYGTATYLTVETI